MDLKYKVLEGQQRYDVHFNIFIYVMYYNI